MAGDAFGVVDVDVPEEWEAEERHRFLPVDQGDHRRATLLRKRLEVGPPTCLEDIALRRRLQRREDEEQPEQADGSSLRRVRRLSLGLLYLFVRLGGSLLDVERELHVVVVDANAVVRLE